MIIITKTELIVNNNTEKILSRYQNISLHEFDLNIYRDRILKHLEDEYGQRFINDDYRNPVYDVHFNYIQIKNNNIN